jgi:hypothetical protein
MKQSEERTTKGVQKKSMPIKYLQVQYDFKKNNFPE